MNKIYKLKYDRRRNQLVAVSELTTGAGKEATGSVAGECGLRGVSTFRRLLGILTPLAVLTGLVIGMLPGLALANPDLPVGGQVVAGQGSISISGNQMTIHQGTHGLVTNWHSFDIGQNHTVQFVQPDSSAVALNRVTGGHESQILGTLTANGQVMLVNPAGVMFGKGARVNTAGLLASTKNISTEDFMAGRYTFSGGSHPGAEIVNQGSLTTTKGGYIVLAADRVRNSGTLSTPSGKTVLAAADRVTLQLDNTGLASVSVNGSVVNALVENSGLIAATNGQVYLTARGKDMLLNTVVNNSGTVEARGLNHRGGEIVLDGGESGVVSQSGMLLADSETGRGGKITVQGANIHLAGGSRTSATGRTGGGGVYVGGGWQGKDVAIRNASKVVMDRDAVIDVSATEKGDGGKAVLWSEDYTNFRGRILAKGGAQSGNGGQVETSSHHNLQAFGDVEASALNGRGGNWLLDPEDIKIINGTGNATESSGEGGIFTPGSGASSVSNATIEQRLNNGTSVTIKTAKEGGDTGSGGNITFESSISKTAGADARLSLEADGNINITNHKISSTQGKLDVNLQGGGSHSGIIFLDKASITTNGGNISLGQLNHTDGSTSALTVKVANGSVLNASGVSGSPSGNISISAFNPNVDLTATELNASSPALNVRNGGSLLEVNNSTLTGGDISLTGTQSGANGKSLPVFLTNATLVAGGDISLQGNNSADSAPAQLELRYKNTLTAGGNITVSSTKAGVFLNGSSATNNISLSAGRNITVQGQNETAGFKDGVNISKATLTSSAGNVTVTGIGSPAGIGVNISSGSIEARMGNVTLSGEGTVEKGVALVNEKVTAGDITVTGSTRDWAGVLLTNSSLNASGSLSLKGDATGYWKGYEAHPQGVKIQQGSSLVAAGDLTVTGSAKNNGQGLILDRSTVNSSGVGDIVLTGTAGNNAQGGANVTCTTISAASGNVTLNGSVSVVSGGATGMYLSGVGITATAGDIAVNGVGYDSGQGALRLTGNNNFSAQNTVLSGEAGRNNIGTLLSGNLNVTAGNLSVAGMTHHYNNDVKNIYRGLKADGLVLDVSNGGLTLSGQALAYDGMGPQTGGTVGLDLKNSTLKASHAAVNGSSVFSGSGFVLDNVTLSGGIEHGNNMTFSSNGSAANVTNTLGVNGGLGYDVFQGMQKSGIDNDTSVFINVDADVLQQMRFNATSGWTYDASDITKSANDKAGTWGLWFTGIDACTTGSISLTGVNLTNSNLTGSSLTLRGADDAPLTVQDTDLNATSGDISLNSGGSIELAGGNVSGQNVSVSSVGGDINSTANITKNDGGDGTLNLSAAGNITFNSKVSVTNVSEKLDVNLLGAGTQSGKISLTGANIATNGGNITLGQLNHSDDSATALTVKVGGKSVLNASGASGNGTINMSAFNPDVDLNVPEFTNTVRNGGAILEVNDSTLVGGDISLTGTQSGEYGKAIPVYLNTATLTASGNISLLGNNSVDSTTAWLELRDKNTLTAGGNITVNSTGAGVWLNASSAAKSTSLNAADTITVQGKNAGLRTEIQDGVKIMHAVLNASHASLAGATDGDGQGFSLNNVTLSGGIEKGNNLTLSSESSGANVTNTLNVTGGIGYSAFEMLQHAGIDNNTSVLVNVETNDLPSVGLTDATSDWTYDAREAVKPANSKAGRWGVSFTGINVSTSGNISLIGVNLTNSNLTGGNLTLQGLGDSPLTVQNTNLTASSGNASLISEGTISLSGGNVQALQGSVNVQAGGVNGTAGGNALSVSNVNFSSLNGTTLSGLSAQNGAGVKLTGNINVTQGDLTVNGTTTRVNNATNVRGIDARGANINVSGTNAVLNMTGAVKGDADAEQTQSVVGLDLGAIKNGKNWVTPRINATSASLTGTSTAKGMGFILNASLSDSLKSTDSNNLNLSSLGSDDAAYNYIGDQVDDDFVHHMIEAGTSIGSKTEVQKVNIYKAELQDWLDDSSRNSFDLNKDFGEWILSFSGLHLNTAGDINITGASFSDSQLWAGGNLTLDNGPGNLSLSGSTLKSRSGYMNLTGGNGINLTNGNISAENDITLNADHGYVKISGSSASNRANVSSVNGSILLHGNKNIEVGRGMNFYNVSIHAQKDIDISADGNWSGVRMTNTSISSESGGIDINASARKAGYDYTNAENAALILTNDIVFDSRTGANINVSNTNVIKNYSPSVALVFEVENMLIKGGGNINASSSYGAVVLSPTPGHMAKDSKSTLTVQEGDLIINAQLDERAKGGPNGAYGSSAAGAFVFNNGYNPIEFNIKTNKGNVIINADSSANKNAPFNAFAAATPQSTANMGKFNGFRFSGDSNVSITAIADQADAINLRLFDNTELTGHLSITGKSTSGTGVIFDRRLNTKVINATISGSSFSGDGTKLIAQLGSADLNGNIMTGISDTATGVSISGSNVSITNGTVSGTSGGNGDGVQLTGGTNYTIDGATVTGQSQSGNGIGVGGTLRVSNATLKGDTVTGSGVNISGRLNTSNTAITGNATGNGTGVFVSGTLIADSGKNNYLTGNSAQGNGVFLSETAELTNIVVSGGSVSGTGVVQDENAILTNVTLHGTDGSGSDLGTGGNVNDSGSVLPGESGISDGGIFNGVPTNDSLNVPPSTGTGSHVTDYNWQNVVKQRQHLWRLQASREQDERSLRQVIPASGYREPEKPVVVDICTDGEVSCRHLDAGMRNRPSHP
ncbi:TPA: filamentous hemagglutinin N-terminal domain-containing protein [Salmonella enterica]|uniref:Filamentous hemagglutinin N-terminal domain-containing protein n=1 Tax=Salmonella enterica TaxID=28901 RepID=A0A759HHP5_SALER|nr:filamentous hemagglutinin N-terminal domain-containing protein [Salmonella enterica]